MTLVYPAAFHASLPAGHDGVFDWDFLKGACPRSIMPMDIDGNIEIKGRFLVFETKDYGVPVPDGQRIALNAMLEFGAWTVVFLWGKSGRQRHWRWERRGIYSGQEFRPCTEELVWQFTKLWADHADVKSPCTTFESAIRAHGFEAQVRPRGGVKA